MEVLEFEPLSLNNQLKIVFMCEFGCVITKGKYRSAPLNICLMTSSLQRAKLICMIWVLEGKNNTQLDMEKNVIF
jgi:hypothetical protein